MQPVNARRLVLGGQFLLLIRSISDKNENCPSSCPVGTARAASFEGRGGRGMRCGTSASGHTWPSPEPVEPLVHWRAPDESNLQTRFPT